MKLWFQAMETRVSSVWNQSFKRLKLFEDTVDLIDLTARCIDRTASAVPINLFIQSATTHLPVNNA